MVVGAHRLKDLNEPSQKRYYIEKVVVRPNFDEVTFKNDMMLLRVKTRIAFNDNVQPICVDASVFPANTSCFVAGWGTIDPFGKYGTARCVGRASACWACRLTPPCA